MKKAIVSVLAVLTVLGVAAQVWLLGHFAQQPPRLEILFEQTVPQSAYDTLLRFAPQREDTLLVLLGDGRSIFFADEVQDLLHQAGVEGFSLNDRTQALRLARQSMGLYLFVLELIAFLLLLQLLVRIVLRTAQLGKAELADVYLRELMRSRAEKILLWSIVWMLAAIAAIVLSQRLLAFSLFVPAQLVPPHNILDFSFYASLTRGAASQSAYEQLCHTSLTWLYRLCVMNTVIAAVWGAWLGRISRAYLQKGGARHGAGNREKSL